MERWMALAAGLTLLVGTACEPTDENCGPSGPVAGATCRATFTTSFDQEREYLIHVPAGHRSGEAVPMLVTLHGNGHSVEIHEAGSELSKLADREGFIVVYPENGDRWDPIQNSPDDTAFVLELVDELVATHDVDPAQIYLNGISSGATVAWDLACGSSERWAAMSLMVPAVSLRSPGCDPAETMPVQLVFGELDNLVGWPEGSGNLQGPPEIIATWTDVNSADLALEETGALMDRWIYENPDDPLSDVEIVLGHELTHWWPNEPGAGFDGAELLWSFVASYARR